MASFAKGTLDDPYTVAEACAAVKDLTWTSGSVYDTTDEVYVKGIVSDIVTTYTETGSYGNASFHIKDPGGSEVFYCFRVLYFGFQKFTAGETDVNVGDEVIIYGKLMNYKESTPETASGQAFLYSLNGDIGHPTAIDAPVPETTAPNRYYSPSGQRIDGKPTQPGVYIVNGKKVMVINSQ